MKEERFQWSFETTIQKVQETNPPWSLQKVFNPSVNSTETERINFGIIEKKLVLSKTLINVLPYIGQQLLDSKHTLTMGQLFHLAPNQK